MCAAMPAKSQSGREVCCPLTAPGPRVIVCLVYMPTTCADAVTPPTESAWLPYSHFAASSHSPPRGTTTITSPALPGTAVSVSSSIPSSDQWAPTQDKIRSSFRKPHGLVDGSRPRSLETSSFASVLLPPGLLPASNSWLPVSLRRASFTFQSPLRGRSQLRWWERWL